MKLAALAGITVVTLSGYLAASLLRDDREVFMPGETTHGHYQIELACEACHTTRFAGIEDLQVGCMNCHGDQLKASDDSHPKKKFTDPRNADRVEILDARYCVTCHQEHVPERTLAMGLTLPGDYCFQCHETVGEERPTHAGLAFDSCATGGCHNFHDNRSLYEDFLVKHRDDATHRVPALLTATTAAALHAPLAEPAKALAPDAPPGIENASLHVAEWQASAHARAEVNCTDCHVVEGTWADTVAIETCGECHAGQLDGFGQGRHGMRLAHGFEPMRPELARLPMHADAAGKRLDCNSCHGAHAFDRTQAAAEACSGCHADAHTLAWADSKHAALFEAERRGEAPAGSGVSCAACHLPRVERDGEVIVHHDQNDNLRPNEKMIRSVCLDCHGLGFSIDALADEELVRSNFNGLPAQHVQSIDWAASRLQ